MLALAFKYRVATALATETPPTDVVTAYCICAHERPQPPVDADMSTAYTSKTLMVAGAASTTVGVTGAAGASTVALLAATADHVLQAERPGCTMHLARNVPPRTATELRTRSAPAPTMLTWFGDTHEHLDVAADANTSNCEHGHVAAEMPAWSVLALKLTSTAVPSLLNCAAVNVGGGGGVLAVMIATVSCVSGVPVGVTNWYREASVPEMVGSNVRVPGKPLVLVQSCVIDTEYPNADPDDEIWALWGTIDGWASFDALTPSSLLPLPSPLPVTYHNAAPNDRLMSDGGGELTDTANAPATELCEYTDVTDSANVIGRKPPVRNVVLVFATAVARDILIPALLTV
jgi:hypothetical protein